MVIDPYSMEFCNGISYARVPKSNRLNFGNHPGGYQSSVDAATGSLRWTRDEVSDVMSETGPFWGGKSTQDDG